MLGIHDYWLFIAAGILLRQERTRCTSLAEASAAGCAPASPQHSVLLSAASFTRSQRPRDSRSCSRPRRSLSSRSSLPVVHIFLSSRLLFTSSSKRLQPDPQVKPARAAASGSPSATASSRPARSAALPGAASRGRWSIAAARLLPLLLLGAGSTPPRRAGGNARGSHRRGLPARGYRTCHAGARSRVRRWRRVAAGLENGGGARRARRRPGIGVASHGAAACRIARCEQRGVRGGGPREILDRALIRRDRRPAGAGLPAGPRSSAAPPVATASPGRNRRLPGI